MIYSTTVENIKASIDSDDDEIILKARKKLMGIKSIKPLSLHIRRKSIDARHKDNIIFVCSVGGEVECSTNEPPTVENVKFYKKEHIEPVIGSEKMNGRPVIIGFGPAGMFCALELAEHGYAPIVYERGADIKTRVKLTSDFMTGGTFSESTNVQFGAGGAGTFSDGKLTTRIGDSLCENVTEKLIALGAPEKISWMAKPHIGTDVLREIVANADARVRELGGEINYNCKADAIKHGTVRAGGDTVKFGALVLAIGHSARDTYAELLASGFNIIPKPFSAGVRIEHLREEIDRAMYGKIAEKGILPPAEYAVSFRKGERGVYSFCMCPGGVVVPAASEAGGVVTNGMSFSERDGVNSNSALAVSVLPEDYGATPMGAIEFQRRMERAAYAAGGNSYRAPAQTVGSLYGRSENKLGRVTPSYMNGDVVLTELEPLMPGFISGMLKEGITTFGRKIRGFDSDDAVLTGFETRTSAPVRILRSDVTRTVDGADIYPCGEGAGYAGGIMSAAVDGIKTARAIIAKYAPIE